MLNKDFNTSYALTLQPHTALESEKPLVHLTAIDGGKQRGVGRNACAPSLGTNGLHLVPQRMSEIEHVPCGADSLQNAPVQISVLNPGYPLLLRPMLFISLLCCVGVLVWFAN